MVICRFLFGKTFFFTTGKHKYEKQRRCKAVFHDNLIRNNDNKKTGRVLKKHCYALIEIDRIKEYYAIFSNWQHANPFSVTVTKNYGRKKQIPEHQQLIRNNLLIFYFIF